MNFSDALSSLFVFQWVIILMWSAVLIELVALKFIFKHREISFRSVGINLIGARLTRFFSQVLQFYVWSALWRMTGLGQYTLFEVNSVSMFEFFLLVLAAIVCSEFYYYVMHVLNHRFDFLWSMHQHHHSSRFLNYSVGMRTPVFLSWQGFSVLLLLGLIGFPPEVVATVISFNLLYGLWTHSDYWPPMPALSKVLITPGDHCKHHENVDTQLRSNYGSILSVFDRLFKTFSETECKRVYGCNADYDSESYFESQLVPVKNYLKRLLPPEQ